MGLLSALSLSLVLELCLAHIEILSICRTNLPGHGIAEIAMCIFKEFYLVYVANMELERLNQLMSHLELGMEEEQLSAAVSHGRWEGRETPCTELATQS